MTRPLLTALGLFVLVGVAFSAPRKEALVTKTSRNEGNRRIGFSVTCSSTAWTVVVSSLPARRSVVMHTLGSMIYSVCIGTQSLAGDLCNDAAPGVELSTNTSITDYSEAVIRCRARSPSTGEILKGFDYYDTGD